MRHVSVATQIRDFPSLDFVLRLDDDFETYESGQRHASDGFIRLIALANS